MTGLAKIGGGLKLETVTAIENLDGLNSIPGYGQWEVCPHPFKMKKTFHFSMPPFHINHSKSVIKGYGPNLGPSV